MPDGLVISSESMNKASNVAVPNPELEKRRAFFTKFWEEFIRELDFDVPGQNIPIPSIHQNLFVYPGGDKNSSWISAYFSQSSKRVGVYFRCGNNQNGIQIAEKIFSHKEEIIAELGDEVFWPSEFPDTDGFGVRFPLNDVYSEENREAIKDYFKQWLNAFVNVVRPIIKGK